MPGPKSSIARCFSRAKLYVASYRDFDTRQCLQDENIENAIKHVKEIITSDILHFIKSMFGHVYNVFIVLSVLICYHGIAFVALFIS